MISSTKVFFFTKITGSSFLSHAANGGIGAEGCVMRPEPRSASPWTVNIAGTPRNRHRRHGGHSKH